MKQKITVKNIKSFLEGNIQLGLEQLHLQPEHIQEQISYRMLKCSDCVKVGKCKVCGCNVPGKLYVKESCNKGERFPDLMSNLEWIKYKESNDIK